MKTAIRKDNPTPRDVHIDSMLTNISVSYIQNQALYIASRVFPMLPVDKQSDQYFTFDKDDWFRDEAAPRAPATESVGSGYRYGKDRYDATVYAFHKDVDDQTRANADNPLNPDREATEFVTQRMLMRMERDWATQYFAPVWGSNLVGAPTAPGAGGFLQWDQANSDPVGDIEAARAAMVGTTGFLPNTLVIGYDVWVALKQHPAIYDRIKWTTADSITEQILARYFEVDRIFVARAIWNPTAEGKPGQFQFVYGKNALLCYSAPNAGLQTPTAGYAFTWRGVSDGAGLTVGTTRFRMPELRSDRVESQMAWDFKMVADDMGTFFESAVA